MSLTSRFMLLCVVGVLTVSAGAVLAGRHDTGVAPQLADVDPFIHRTNFLVADLDRTFRVYGDILGFKLDGMAPASELMDAVFNLPAEADTRIAFMSSGEGNFGTIAFTEAKGVALSGQAVRSPTVLIVEVQRDLAELRDLLAAEGCEIVDIYDLENPARMELLFSDPDGYRVILMKLDPPA